MPEIESEITFNTTACKCIFHLLQDGDTLVLNGLELTKEQVASLSWLIGHPSCAELEIQIRIKP